MIGFIRIVKYFSWRCQQTNLDAVPAFSSISYHFFPRFKAKLTKISQVSSQRLVANVTWPFNIHRIDKNGVGCYIYLEVKRALDAFVGVEVKATLLRPF